MTNTLAGEMLPAAVVSIGRNLPSAAAPISTRLVAGDGALRRQHVHRLGARDARHQLERERGDACAAASALTMSALWPGRSSEMSVAPAVDAARSRAALGGCTLATIGEPRRRRAASATIVAPALSYSVVAKPGAEPGAALHDDLELQLLDQPRHTVRRERDSLLARSGFGWNADSH